MNNECWRASCRNEPERNPMATHPDLSMLGCSSRPFAIFRYTFSQTKPTREKVMKTMFQDERGDSRSILAKRTRAPCARHRNSGLPELRQFIITRTSRRPEVLATSWRKPSCARRAPNEPKQPAPFSRAGAALSLVETCL